MNPHATHSTSPTEIWRSIWNHRSLIKQMAWREVVGRSKGSIFGLAWSFFNPLMMLAVYTFVFSVVFKARWGIEVSEGKADFALILFVGLIIHALLSEVLNRAPTLVSLGVALFNTAISFLVFLVASLALNGLPSWTIIYTPLTLLPLLPLTLGLGWLLASLGVYLRDIGQLIGIISMVLLFLAPVFYPLKALPEAYQSFLYINPLTYPIEQTRAVIIFGDMPNWVGLGVYTIISVLTCWVGFWWFQRTRRGFADVL